MLVHHSPEAFAHLAKSQGHIQSVVRRGELVIILGRRALDWRGRILGKDLVPQIRNKLVRSKRTQSKTHLRGLVERTSEIFFDGQRHVWSQRRGYDLNLPRGSPLKLPHGFLFW